jgi:hypothetical protein
VTNWGDSTLHASVEREFAHLFAMTGPDRRLFLARLLGSIVREPSVSGILEDLRHEAEAVPATFLSAELTARKDLAMHRGTRAEEINARLASVLGAEGKERQLSGYASIDSYDERLTAARWSAAAFESDTERSIIEEGLWPKDEGDE